MIKVGVIGTGNVGWALVGLLAQQANIEKIFVCGRSEERVTALIMDICSANPEAFDKVHSAKLGQLEDVDVIILTAGVQIKPELSAGDIRAANIEITRKYLSGMKFKSTAILITLATPVDDITVFAQLITGLPRNQVFGFGGDLDRNRLEFVLRQKGFSYDLIELVGEHGKNAIPVYPGEDNYKEVASEVRGFLRKVTTLAGETRNLSTATLLTKLIISIANNSFSKHYLCGFNSDLNIYLTWPFKVGSHGIEAHENIPVMGNAKIDLDALVESRREITEYMRSLL